MSTGLLKRTQEAINTVFRYQADRVIVCPETKRGEAVHVDALHALQTAFEEGQPHLRLTSCSRWPERQNCEQMCLSQIEASPEDCLARNMLTSWYAGKFCVYCAKPVDHLHWHDHHPALISPKGITREWSQIEARDLPEVLSTHHPVCWNCHMAETFRREHPELVTDRNFTVEDRK